MLSPPAPRGERAATSTRASITTIEEAITSVELAVADEPARPTPAPRYVDLDSPAGLTPRAARLDDLIRAILRDPRWLRGESIEAIAARAAARQVPAANPSLIREAIHRIDPLWDCPAFQALRAAEPGSVRYDVTFTIPYSPDESTTPPTVFHGTCDVLFRDWKSEWQLIVIADAGACRASQSLRLQLSARAAAASGLAPIRQGWIVRHGGSVESACDIETALDPDALARARARHAEFVANPT
jgi:hypothetical protein